VSAAGLHRELVRGADPQLLGALREPGPQARSPRPVRIVGSGPRADGRREHYELLVAMIHEGHELHYRGAGCVVRPDDPDLALLLGDQLYALGLARLAELGDLDAVAELADVISLTAQAHAGDDPDLADAVWEAGASAVGWGSGEAHREAKALARAGDPAATEALRTAARLAREQHGQLRPEGE
jgi:hypothetical protein